MLDFKMAFGHFGARAISTAGITGTGKASIRATAAGIGCFANTEFSTAPLVGSLQSAVREMSAAESRQRAAKGYALVSRQPGEVEPATQPW